MKITKVCGTYFSPTGHTAQAVRAVMNGTGLEQSIIDLTRPENREREYEFSAEELLVIGAPVYGGRIPSVSEGIFEHLHGQGTPAIFLVTYGNRAYEDALLELAEQCQARGFVPIAASAVVAQHSYSVRIASGQPDQNALDELKAFGKQVIDWAKTACLEEVSLSIPGNHPYRDFPGMPFAPEPDDTCVKCMACAKVCPVAAISSSDPTCVDAARCIDCYACVMVCPKHSREIRHPAFVGKPQKMEQAFGSPTKKNEFFTLF
ncbi:MAG: 4Fe-4S binding protein [Massiliimalia sp.]